MNNIIKQKRTEIYVSMKFWASRYIMCPNSDIRVKSYDHSNLARASVVQFRASRWVYVRESDIRVKSSDNLNFLKASVVQLQTSRYIMRLNQTTVLKVMFIRISRELPLLNFERLDILCPKIGHPCEMLWPV